ncbi:MAG: TatD family hydrolase [Lachnospiraceae bacterium]|nr:TatD family hydrolase [Lachnospiraceae bacterium]
MIFETHAHYDDPAFDRDRDRLLALLKDEGIAPIVNIGASIESTKSTVELAHRYDHVYAAIGVHPSDCGDLTENDIEWLKDLSSDEKVVAIGEIGLDYHYDEPDREIQKKWFIRQLELARETSLPIVVHSRDAAQDTYEIIKDFRGLRGVIHCFSYSAELAREYVKMGYYIGVGGVVTFKNGRKLHEVVKEIPLESIVVETDAPYLSPEPYRGRRNSSAFIPYIIERIADLKNVSYETVERALYDNATDLYKVRADGQTC